MKTNQEQGNFFASNQQSAPPAATAQGLDIREPYIPPTIEVLSFKIEKGFAISRMPGKEW